MHSRGSICRSHPRCRRQSGGKLRWCGRRDSNSHTLRRQNLNLVCLPISPRPRGQTIKQKRQAIAWRFGIWGGRWESNPRHQEPQSCALPTELRPPYCICLCQSCQMARPAGLEPATIRLEGGCSIQLSYGRLSICKRRLKAFGFGRDFATPAFAVLPSDWLCSTSGAHVI